MAVRHWRGLRVTIDLRSPIVDHGQPLHLDGLLSLAWVQRHARPGGPGGGAERGDDASELVTPHLQLGRLGYRGRYVWLASAGLYSAPMTPAPIWQTKRRDTEDWDRLATPQKVTAGPGKDYMLRRPGLVTPTLTFLAWGKRQQLRRDLKLLLGPPDCPHGCIGAARRAGAGEVASWRVEHDDDLTPRDVLVSPDGLARRHLPASWLTYIEAPHFGATIPPYYHPARHTDSAKVGTGVVLHEDLEELLCSF